MKIDGRCHCGALAYEAVIAWGISTRRKRVKPASLHIFRATCSWKPSVPSPQSVESPPN